MPYGQTTRSDVVIPEILVDAIQGEFKGKNLLYGSPAAVVNNTLPGGVKRGQTVTVPYFNTLGEMEDIENEGDALTAEKITMDDETATVRHSGKAFEITEWAEMSSMGDPYAEAARQFRVIADRRVDKALIDVATAADLPSTFINDISGTGAGTLDWDTMVDSTAPWGDEQENIVLLGVHSKVARTLMKLKDSLGHPLLVVPTTDSEVPRFMGKPVVISDKCKRIDVNGDGSLYKYESILVKAAALAFWFQQVPKVLTGQDIMSDSQIAAIHMYWVAHRYKRVRGTTNPGVVKIISK